MPNKIIRRMIMIKCDKGRIEIKGTPMVLVGELGTVLCQGG